MKKILSVLLVSCLAFSVDASSPPFSPDSVECFQPDQCADTLVITGYAIVKRAALAEVQCISITPGPDPVFSCAPGILMDPPGLRRDSWSGPDADPPHIPVRFTEEKEPTWSKVKFSFFRC